MRALFGDILLGDDLRTAMQVPVLERDANGQPIAAYGLGVEMMTVDGVTWVGHSGSTFGYLSGLWHQPQLGTTVVVGLNSYPKDKNLLGKLVTRAIRAAAAKGGVAVPQATPWIRSTRATAGRSRTRRVQRATWGKRASRSGSPLFQTVWQVRKMSAAL